MYELISRIPNLREGNHPRSQFAPQGTGFFGTNVRSVALQSAEWEEVGDVTGEALLLRT